MIIIAHQAQKSILLTEDAWGVSLETGGVGPREEGSTPITEQATYSPGAGAGKPHGKLRSSARAAACFCLAQ
jgi:hypothetical protein